MAARSRILSGVQSMSRKKSDRDLVSESTARVRTKSEHIALIVCALGSNRRAGRLKVPKALHDYLPPGGAAGRDVASAVSAGSAARELA
eukprot:CAMPEP_0181207328 /NCGR_PEP_ID=MMETSP1096-20121128/21525_1 /TAXON_ID=156174 ORGANISM="Chrysochromulina ericina, Strain CCMP281" /NCGR_SAMPLE_ID=MMETSP1096 /ASSEMBLY_ACC=CAM_ASM_000453 /LENGTH=88 /DNA_ID=CAMNT_0023298317 /DNA_START=1046 /DNA_END=1313 /DNA_ORIENTATION=+